MLFVSGDHTWWSEAMHDSHYFFEKFISPYLTESGENGAGKTTFVKLLTRLYDPTEGDIFLNGININMSIFSTVFQDYKLFSFSLKDNVALALPMDEAKVQKVLRYVGFEEKLQKLPKGIETAIYKNFDESGFEPSGGEGQKIALARALYKGAPVVILDEPTAALDPRAEYEIYQQFNDMVKGKTAVYISHRLSSTKFCDVIAVFDGGRIVEYGSHEELMKRGGIYSELFNMQAQFYTGSVECKDDVRVSFTTSARRRCGETAPYHIDR